ncbi:hypothetical protein FACS189491_00410 [Spirochaetia bacterium]|nr:hypothetical protein FACS189491_00410 [Spirochaetia bacterium]
MLLEQLAFTAPRITRQISAENPTGEKGGACRWSKAEDTLDNGRGLKVHPFLKLKAGSTVVLADIAGPGCIKEIFITTDHQWLSELVLRIYWDDEEAPSVEAPLGAFFANGFDEHKHPVYSIPVAALPRNAYNCYWQMPFRKKARITLTHEGPEDVNCVAYRVLYQLYEIPEDPLYFHAQYRRAETSTQNPTFTIVDGIQGPGKYVGTYLAWNSLSSGWWGEGEVKFYIDGDGLNPSLADNGTEDYFGGSFGFSSFNTGLCGDDEQVFSTAFLGMPLALTTNHRGGGKFSLYRWHILDDIGFFKDIKVTVDTLGWWRNPGCRPLEEDIAAVAYWYQREPHIPFKKLPPVERRWDR